MRTDTALIKHIYRSSPDAAAIYNRLPLFIMPAEADELLRYDSDLLASAPDVLPLPFDNFILDYPFGVSPLLEMANLGPVENRGRLWVRVRPTALLRQDAATLLSLKHLPSLSGEWLFLEGWEERTTTGGLPPAPDHSLIPVDVHRYGDFAEYLHYYPTMDVCQDRACGIWCNIQRCLHPGTVAFARCSGSELIHAAICRLVVLSLIYLSEGLGGVTTEIIYTPRSAREERTEKLKPWVAPRRSTFIIIDPARAGEYGHPSGEKRGTHASPIPHARRGHWRHLEDRRTWVRPAWIGATEWEHEGRIYKIRKGTL